MSIILLHLGDIHIADNANPVLQRIDQIVAAVRSRQVVPAACFVVMAGDVAFSGKPAQYTLAEGFVRELLSRLEQEYPGLNPNVVFVPGNHDCDLAVESDIRREGLSEPALSRLDVKGGFIREFLQVQSSFFEFASTFGQAQANPLDRLLFRRVFVTEQRHTVAFSCYNTSWMSKNPEVAGTLHFPNTIHANRHGLVADAEIALFHHPYNWLAPDNAIEFRAAIEKRFDIVITGHEHRDEHYQKVTAHSSVEFVAGSAMYDPRETENGFNVIELDLDPIAPQWTLNTFVWDARNFYRAVGAASPRPFSRNQALLSEGFTNNAKFNDELTDIGTGFTHSKKHLRLSDVLVYPSLKHRKLQRDTDGQVVSPQRIKSKELVDFVTAQPRLFILAGVYS